MMRGASVMALAAFCMGLAWRSQAVDWRAPQRAAPDFWRAQALPTTASLRGLDAVGPRVIWASGTGGTFLRTLDGGRHWTARQVTGAERLDFRDIKAFGSDVAYMAAVAGNGGVYKTTDGGASWKLQYRSTAPGFFLDGLAFWNAKHGLALGDPMQGEFLLLATSDGGAHWRRIAGLPPSLPGEGAFAASGTALVAGANGTAWFATGGASISRVFRTSDWGATWTAVTVPVAAGSAGAGIFSLAFSGADGIAMGGDYTHPGQSARNTALSRDGGRSWSLAPGPLPSGYRSAVAFVPGSHGKRLVAVGSNGADVSADGGASWRRVSDAGFNSVAAAGNVLWAVGPHGRAASVRVSAWP